MDYFDQRASFTKEMHRLVPVCWCASISNAKANPYATTYAFYTAICIRESEGTAKWIHPT